MEQQIIKCVFCKGTGKNPYFKGTCPVCKGKGKNEMTGKYVTCSSCRGSGQKKGTTLTCYDCAGLGVVPDTRETFRIAREEIGEAQKEMARERAELTEKPMIKITPASSACFSESRRAGRPKSKKHKLLDMFSKRKGKEDEWGEEREEETGGKTHFCQYCGDKVNESASIKICLSCFNKVKELKVYKEI